jgi:hypothetical protein
MQSFQILFQSGFKFFDRYPVAPARPVIGTNSFPRVGLRIVMKGDAAFFS